MEEKYYDLQQISDRLLTPVSYLRRMVKEGKLKGMYIGKKFVIGQEALRQYLKSVEVETNGK